MKKDISAYLQVLYDASPAAVGGSCQTRTSTGQPSNSLKKAFHLPPLCRGTQRGGVCFPVAIPLQKFYNERHVIEHGGKNLWLALPFWSAGSIVRWLYHASPATTTPAPAISPLKSVARRSTRRTCR
ncbi:MAG: hypothetical protein ACLVJH_12155 [Faecalibacterium prausnitzii]